MPTSASGELPPSVPSATPSAGPTPGATGNEALGAAIGAISQGASIGGGVLAKGATPEALGEAAQAVAGAGAAMVAGKAAPAAIGQIAQSVAGAAASQGVGKALSSLGEGGALGESAAPSVLGDAFGGSAPKAPTSLAGQSPPPDTGSLGQAAGTHTPPANEGATPAEALGNDGSQATSTPAGQDAKAPPTDARSSAQGPTQQPSNADPNAPDAGKLEASDKPTDNLADNAAETPSKGDPNALDDGELSASDRAADDLSDSADKPADDADELAASSPDDAKDAPVEDGTPAPNESSAKTIAANEPSSPSQALPSAPAASSQALTDPGLGAFSQGSPALSSVGVAAVVGVTAVNTTAAATSAVLAYRAERSPAATPTGSPAPSTSTTTSPAPTTTQQEQSPAAEGDWTEVEDTSISDDWNEVDASTIPSRLEYKTWIGDINPNHSTINCVLCSVNTEKALRGDPIQAADDRKGEIVEMSTLLERPTLAGRMGNDAALKAALAGVPGNRAIVGGRWLNGGEHAVNVIVGEDGKRIFLDGQKGGPLTWLERQAFKVERFWVTHRSGNASSSSAQPSAAPSGMPAPAGSTPAASSAAQQSPASNGEAATSTSTSNGEAATSTSTSNGEAATNTSTSNEALEELIAKSSTWGHPPSGADRAEATKVLGDLMRAQGADDALVNRLGELIANPSSIAQDGFYLCALTSTVHSLLKNDLGAFARLTTAVFTDQLRGRDGSLIRDFSLDSADSSRPVQKIVDRRPEASKPGAQQKLLSSAVKRANAGGTALGKEHLLDYVLSRSLGKMLSKMAPAQYEADAEATREAYPGYRDKTTKVAKGPSKKQGDLLLSANSLRTVVEQVLGGTAQTMVEGSSYDIDALKRELEQPGKAPFAFATMNVKALHERAEQSKAGLSQVTPFDDASEVDPNSAHQVVITGPISSNETHYTVPIHSWQQDFTIQVAKDLMPKLFSAITYGTFTPGQATPGQATPGQVLSGDASSTVTGAPADATGAPADATGVSLTSSSGTTTLTPESAREWLRQAELAIPEHLDGASLDLFLNTRGGTYNSNQQEEFLSNLEGFHQAHTGIEMARRNLDAYEKHLTAKQAESLTDEMARRVLGAQEGVEVSKDALDAARKAIIDALAEEKAYVAEARASLEAQSQWHEGGRVDKGRVSTETVRAAVSTVGEGLQNVSAKEKPKALARAKDKAKYAYYEPARNRLMSQGFVVSPPGTALGAVFPEKDWIRDDLSDEAFLERAQGITDELVKRHFLLGDGQDSLTRLLMPENVPATEEEREALKSAVGCLCVSWTRHQDAGKTVYVPVLGLSSVLREEPDSAFFERYHRHLGLPSWGVTKEFEHEVEPREYKPLDEQLERIEELTEDQRKKLDALGGKDQLEALGGSQKKKAQRKAKSEQKRGKDEEAAKEKQEIPADIAEKLEEYRDVTKKLNKARRDVEADREKHNVNEPIRAELETNREAMIHRTNLAALGYRARTQLGLRTPARQALLSYVSFREKSHEDLRLDTLYDIDWGVDLWMSGWHSLNCAEPAALMTASSYFGEGADVLVCFPYEGLRETGLGQNRPKETCPWCAAVELGFRSVSGNQGEVDAKVKSGDWATQITRPQQLEPAAVLPVNSAFDAHDDANEIMQATRESLAGDGKAELVKNRDLKTRAYAPVIETKIGRVRSMYHLLGLLDPEVVALDRDLHAHAPRDPQAHDEGTVTGYSPGSNDDTAPGDAQSAPDDAQSAPGDAQPAPGDAQPSPQPAAAPRANPMSDADLQSLIARSNTWSHSPTREDREQAVEELGKLLRAQGAGDALVQRLGELIRNPGSISQSEFSTCALTGTVYALLENDLGGFTRLVTSLFTGKLFDRSGELIQDFSPDPGKPADAFTNAVDRALPGQLDTSSRELQNRLLSNAVKKAAAKSADLESKGKTWSNDNALDYLLARGLGKMLSKMAPAQYEADLAAGQRQNPGYGDKAADRPVTATGPSKKRGDLLLSANSLSTLFNQVLGGTAQTMVAGPDYDIQAVSDALSQPGAAPFALATMMNGQVLRDLAKEHKADPSTVRPLDDTTPLDASSAHQVVINGPITFDGTHYTVPVYSWQQSFPVRVAKDAMPKLFPAITYGSFLPEGALDQAAASEAAAASDAAAVVSGGLRKFLKNLFRSGKSKAPRDGQPASAPANTPPASAPANTPPANAPANTPPASPPTAEDLRHAADLAALRYQEEAEAYEMRLGDYLAGRPEVTALIARFARDAWERTPQDHRHRFGTPQNTVPGAVGPNLRALERVAYEGNFREQWAFLWNAQRQGLLGDLLGTARSYPPTIGAERAWRGDPSDGPYIQRAPGEIVPPLSNAENQFTQGGSTWKGGEQWSGIDHRPPDPSMSLEDSPHATAQSTAGFVKTGTSGTAWFLLNAAEAANYWWGSNLDLGWMRMALIGALVPTGHHTVREVLEAARLWASERPYGPQLGFDYDADWTSYSRLSPLSENELRTHVARDGRFPHEHAFEPASTLTGAAPPDVDPPRPSGQERPHLDEHNIVAPHQSNTTPLQDWNPTHREWYRDQATLLDAYRSEKVDAATKKQLALLMMHSLYKAAAIHPDKADAQGRQVAPFLSEGGTYHRSTPNPLLDKVHLAYEKQLGFSPTEDGKPSGVVHLLDGGPFHEVLEREYAVVRDGVPLEQRVDDIEHFRGNVRRLLELVDEAGTEPVLFDVSSLLSERLDGAPLDAGAVQDVARDIEEAFLDEVTRLLGARERTADEKTALLRKLSTLVNARMQIVAFTEHAGRPVMVTPRLLDGSITPRGEMTKDQQEIVSVLPQMRHRGLGEQLGQTLSKSGHRVDPVTAMEAWLDVESVETIFAGEGIPLTTFAPPEASIPRVHDSLDSFLGEGSTFAKFRELAADPARASDPAVQILSRGTVALLEGLRAMQEQQGVDVQRTFEDRKLGDLLQISYHRMEVAMREAMAFPGPGITPATQVELGREAPRVDPARQDKREAAHFANQMEVIHQQVQAILEIVRPYRDGDFERGVLGYLRPILPGGLTAHAEVYPSAMHTVASTLTAVEEQKGHNQLNVAVLKDSYYESAGAISHAKTYDVTTLDGSTLKGRTPLGDGSLTKPVADVARKKLDVFLGEFRHNISEESNVYAIEDLEHAVDQLFENDLVADRFTVVIDDTIDKLRSDHVERFLDHNRERIASGKLNVSILRSAQKFDMLGMDNYYGGFAVNVNDPQSFERFNQRVKDPGDRLGGLNRQGLTHTLTHMGGELDAYRAGIQANTRALYEKIPAGLKHDPTKAPADNDIRADMRVSTIEGDDGQVFIDVDFTERGEAYYNAFVTQLKAFIEENGLPADERASFGFAVSNVTGLVGMHKVRFNPGLERAELIDKYAEFFQRWFDSVAPQVRRGKDRVAILESLKKDGLKKPSTIRRWMDFVSSRAALVKERLTSSPTASPSAVTTGWSPGDDGTTPSGSRGGKPVDGKAEKLARKYLSAIAESPASDLRGSIERALKDNPGLLEGIGLDTGIGQYLPSSPSSRKRQTIRNILLVSGALLGDAPSDARKDQLLGWSQADLDRALGDLVKAAKEQSRSGKTPPSSRTEPGPQRGVERLELMAGEPRIRIYVESASNMGHQSSSVLLARRLIEWFERFPNRRHPDQVIEFVARDQDALDKTRKLLGGDTLLGTRVETRLLPRNAKDLAPVGHALSGAVDQPDDTFRQLNARTFVALQPRGWPGSQEQVMSGPPGRPSTRILTNKGGLKADGEPDTTMQFRHLPLMERPAEQPGTRSPTAPTDADRAVRELLDQAAGNPDVLVLPVYGMGSGNPMDHYGAAPWINLMKAVRELSDADPNRRIVILNLSKDLGSNPQETWGDVQAAFEGDPKVKIRGDEKDAVRHPDQVAQIFQELGGDTRLSVITVPGDKMLGTMDDAFRESKLPPVFEGQGTLNQVVPMGRPFLKYSMRADLGTSDWATDYLMDPSDASSVALAERLQRGANSLVAKPSQQKPEDHQALVELLSESLNPDSEVSQYFKWSRDVATSPQNDRLARAVDALAGLDAPRGAENAPSTSSPTGYAPDGTTATDPKAGTQPAPGDAQTAPGDAQTAQQPAPAPQASPMSDAALKELIARSNTWSHAPTAADREQAAEELGKLLRAQGAGDALVDRLGELIRNPGSISQSEFSTCALTGTVYALLENDLGGFTRLVTSLFTGKLFDRDGELIREFAPAPGKPADAFANAADRALPGQLDTGSPELQNRLLSNAVKKAAAKRADLESKGKTWSNENALDYLLARGLGKMLSKMAPAQYEADLAAGQRQNPGYRDKAAIRPTTATGPSKKHGDLLLSASSLSTLFNQVLGGTAQTMVAGPDYDLQAVNEALSQPGAAPFALATMMNGRALHERAKEHKADPSKVRPLDDTTAVDASSAHQVVINGPITFDGTHYTVPVHSWQQSFPVRVAKDAMPKLFPAITYGSFLSEGALEQAAASEAAAATPAGFAPVDDVTTATGTVTGAQPAPNDAQTSQEPPAPSEAQTSQEPPAPPKVSPTSDEALRDLIAQSNTWSHPPTAEDRAAATTALGALLSAQGAGDALVDRLGELINDPGSISQSEFATCALTGTVYALLRNDLGGFTRLVTSMFTGKLLKRDGKVIKSFLPSSGEPDAGAPGDAFADAVGRALPPEGLATSSPWLRNKLLSNAVKKAAARRADLESKGRTWSDAKALDYLLARGLGKVLSQTIPGQYDADVVASLAAHPDYRDRPADATGPSKKHGDLLLSANSLAMLVEKAFEAKAEVMTSGADYDVGRLNEALSRPEQAPFAFATMTNGGALRDLLKDLAPETPSDRPLDFAADPDPSSAHQVVITGPIRSDETHHEVPIHSWGRDVTLRVAKDAMPALFPAIAFGSFQPSRPALPALPREKPSRKPKWVRKLAARLTSRSQPEDRHLDENKLVARRAGKEDGEKGWKSTFREWYLDQAMLLDARASARPTMQGKLALLALHSFYKVASISSGRSDTTERQVTPFLEAGQRYHRVSPGFLMDRLHIAYEEALGFPEPGKSSLTRRRIGILHFVDGTSFREVLAREYVVKDLSPRGDDDKPIQAIDSRETFRDAIRKLLENVDRRGETSEDDQLVFDVSDLLEQELGGGKLDPGAVDAMKAKLEEDFATELTAFLDRKGGDADFEAKYAEKLANVTKSLGVAAFAKHPPGDGRTLLVTPPFLAAGGVAAQRAPASMKSIFPEIEKKQEQLRKMITESSMHGGYPLDPISAKQAWLEAAPLEAILRRENIPQVTLGTEGKRGIPEVHRSVGHFLGREVTGEDLGRLAPKLRQALPDGLLARESIPLTEAVTALGAIETAPARPADDEISEVSREPDPRPTEDEVRAAIEGLTRQTTFARFKELVNEPWLAQDPMVQVLAKGTAALLEGLGDLDVHDEFAQEGLEDLLQTIYFRMEAAMREAMAFPKEDLRSSTQKTFDEAGERDRAPTPDPSRKAQRPLTHFLNQMEVIHQQVQTILGVVEPYGGDRDFESALLGRLRKAPPGEEPTIPTELSAVAEALPSSMRSLATTLAGVEALHGTNQLNVAMLKDSYYEAPSTLTHAKTYNVLRLDGDTLQGGAELGDGSFTQGMYGTGTTALTAVRGEKLHVYFGEFRHNLSLTRQSYALEDLEHHVDELFAKDLVAEKFTVAIDNTVDKLRSDHVRRFLEHNAERIKEGKLNVVIFRSAQKFDMLGMDNYYGGFLVGVNDPKTFGDFNERVQSAPDRLKGLNRAGLTHLVEHAGDSLDQYRAAVMANTRALYDALPPGLKHAPGASTANDPRRVMEIAQITGDDGQVFLDIDFKGNDALLTAFSGQLKTFMKEHRAPIDERSSFGFAISNLVPVTHEGIVKLRLNPGLESPEQVAQYAEFFRRWFEFQSKRADAGMEGYQLIRELDKKNLTQILGPGGIPAGAAAEATPSEGDRSTRATGSTPGEDGTTTTRDAPSLDDVARDAADTMRDRVLDAARERVAAAPQTFADGKVDAELVRLAHEAILAAQDTIAAAAGSAANEAATRSLMQAAAVAMTDRIAAAVKAGGAKALDGAELGSTLSRLAQDTATVVASRAGAAGNAVTPDSFLEALAESLASRKDCGC